MNQTIDTGAYGWRHAHWLDTFYPQDLPSGGDEDDAEDWRLSFYSNQFDAVMIPADYWRSDIKPDCKSWLDDVHEKFRFYVECQQDMFSYISVKTLTAHLKVLQPKLAALVFWDVGLNMQNSQLQSDEILHNIAFRPLLDALQMQSVASGGRISSASDWQQVSICWSALHTAGNGASKRALPKNFAIYENDLTDLRKARIAVESFISQTDDGKPRQENDSDSVIIVKHPQLQAENLNRFRTMLEIMGC